MQLSYRLALTGLPLVGMAASPAAAQTLDLTVTVPRLSVAEYHAPYVALARPPRRSRSGTIMTTRKMAGRSG